MPVRGTGCWRCRYEALAAGDAATSHWLLKIPVRGTGCWRCRYEALAVGDAAAISAL